MNKPGLENKGADALSRMHEEGQLHSLVHCLAWVDSSKVIEEVHQDSKLKAIVTALQQGAETK